MEEEFQIGNFGKYLNKGNLSHIETIQEIVYYTHKKSTRDDKNVRNNDVTRWCPLQGEEFLLIFEWILNRFKLLWGWVKSPGLFVCRYLGWEDWFVIHFSRLSPKIPAKVVLKFFIVSSPSGCSAGSCKDCSHLQIVATQITPQTNCQLMGFSWKVATPKNFWQKTFRPFSTFWPDGHYNQHLDMWQWIHTDGFRSIGFEWQWWYVDCWQWMTRISPDHSDQLLCASPSRPSFEKLPTSLNLCCLSTLRSKTIDNRHN